MEGCKSALCCFMCSMHRRKKRFSSLNPEKSQSFWRVIWPCLAKQGYYYWWPLEWNFAWLIVCIRGRMRCSTFYLLLVPLEAHLVCPNYFSQSNPVEGVEVSRCHHPYPDCTLDSTHRLYLSMSQSANNVNQCTRGKDVSVVAWKERNDLCSLYDHEINK